MKALNYILLFFTGSLFWSCSGSQVNELPGHFHAEAKRIDRNTVEVKLKMPGRFGQTPVYLMDFEPIGRILPAPEEGVKNPGREEVRIGTFIFSENPDEEYKSQEIQGDNEVYTYDADCNNLFIKIQLNEGDLEKVKVASADVKAPKGVKKTYEVGERGVDKADECYKDFKNYQTAISKQPQNLGMILFHFGHKPPEEIEPGMDGILIGS